MILGSSNFWFVASLLQEAWSREFYFTAGGLDRFLIVMFCVM